MNTNKRASAKKTVERLKGKPNQALLIHYSRQNLMDNESGVATPRIIAIMVKSIDGAQTVWFAIHQEAEKANVLLENITDYYDFLEERLLRSFNSFVKNNRNCKWIHWDMNDVHFGFEAIKHRYCVMVEKDGKDFQEISLDNRVNLNTLLQDINGASYETEPVFENLMKSNNGGVCKNDYLSIEDEARAFEKLEFPAILKSLVCKVNFLGEILDRIIDDSLEISTVNKNKRKNSSTEEHPIIYLLKSFTFWAVVTVAGGAGFTLGNYFGRDKFDSEKMNLYNSNQTLTNQNDSLVEQNGKLKNLTDSLNFEVHKGK